MWFVFALLTAIFAAWGMVFLRTLKRYFDDQ